MARRQHRAHRGLPPRRLNRIVNSDQNHQNAARNRSVQHGVDLVTSTVVARDALAIAEIERDSDATSVINRWTVPSFARQASNFWGRIKEGSTQTLDADAVERVSYKGNLDLPLETLAYAGILASIKEGSTLFNPRFQNALKRSSQYIIDAAANADIALQLDAPIPPSLVVVHTPPAHSMWEDEVEPCGTLYGLPARLTDYGRETLRRFERQIAHDYTGVHIEKREGEVPDRVWPVTKKKQ